MSRLSMTLSLLALITTPAALAAAGDPGSWEFGSDLGLSVNLSFFDGNTQANLNVGQGSVFTEIGYNLGNGLEIVLAPNYVHQFNDYDAGTASGDTLFLRGGVNYSFMQDVKNSLFAEGLAGMGWDDHFSPSITGFTWALGAGKRFAITDCVTYRPEILYVYDGNGTANARTGTSSGNLNVMPVSFSFFF